MDPYEHINTLTFDCYGTLIDWRAGQRACFQKMFHTDDPTMLDDLAAIYEGTEARIEQGPYCSYREVLRQVAEQLAERASVTLSPEQANGLADSLPTWPVFADTKDALLRLQSRYRLGVLSNVDRDLFGETQKRIGVSFDFVVTAEDVRSYKPAHGHFEALLTQHADRAEVLHVAQSQFHDGVPANELDIAFVWINRYNDAHKSGVAMADQFPDLQSLADRLGCGG